MEYIVLEAGSLTELQTKVNQYLSNGYYLSGGLAVDSVRGWNQGLWKKSLIFYQAMVNENPIVFPATVTVEEVNQPVTVQKVVETVATTTKLK
jgi:hypothetical protein